MRNHHIAIQGSIASFHDLAAKKFFGQDTSVLECGTFKEVCNRIIQNTVDYGIIAIENKVAGSILLNYQLIENYDLRIIGEVFLPIELHLLGKKGTKLSDIEEIISHPMALGQSQNFLSELSNILITEFKDTATSAKKIVEHAGNNIAVIAGPAVAKKYELDIIQDNVADVLQNFTRFHILSKVADYVSDADKASITLQVIDTPGKLSDILHLIKVRGLNMTKIQSVPIPENPDSYSFHMDIEFADRQVFEALMKELEAHTKSLKTLGIYKKESHSDIFRNNKIISKALN